MATSDDANPTYLDRIRTLKTAIDRNDADGTSNDVLTRIWTEENKFLNRACEAVSESVWLAARFGSGMSGALALAPTLRMVYDKHAFDSLLLHYAVKDDDFKDEVWCAAKRKRKPEPKSNSTVECNLTNFTK